MAVVVARCRDFVTSAPCGPAQHLPSSAHEGFLSGGYLVKRDVKLTLPVFAGKGMVKRDVNAASFRW